MLDADLAKRNSEIAEIANLFGLFGTTLHFTVVPDHSRQPDDAIYDRWYKFGEKLALWASS